MTAKVVSIAFRLMNCTSPNTRFWPAILLLLCLLSLYPPGLYAAGAQELPSAGQLISRMIERAKAVASAEDEPQYTYQSQTVLQQLKGSGEVAASEEKTYTVNLIAGYPIRHLTKIKGRELSQKELEQEQAKEVRLRRRFTSLSMEDLAARKQTWLTSNLLARYEFQVQDRVSLNNRSTLLLTFRPKRGKMPVVNPQDRLLNLMAGKVWVDEQDADAAKISIGLVDTLSLGWFGLLGSVSKCDLTLERTRMPDGVWVNANQILEIQFRKLASAKRFRITEVSSGYKRASSPSPPLAESGKAE